MAGTVRNDTLDGYRRDLDNHVKPRLGQKQLTKITPADLKDLYAHLLEHGRLSKVRDENNGLAPATVRSIHTTLHHALKTAVEEGLLPANPADEVTPPKLPRNPKGVLNNDQLDALMTAIRQDPLWHDFFYTELTTGLRRGELLALQWDDLDFQTGELRVQRQVQRIRGELTVTQPKTRSSSRSIILPPPILDILKNCRQHTGSRWMFPSPRKEDSPRDPAAVRKTLSIILERAGCKHVRFHDLRHTFATMSLENGMDVKTLYAIIGHISSATTLNVYAHVTDGMRQSAAAKIDRAIAKAEPEPDAAVKEKPARTTFQAVKGKYRKPGTGCVSQISDQHWEGRYSPKVNGKRMARNVYVHSEEECEEKLANLIEEMKEELAALRTQARAG